MVAAELPLTVQSVSVLVPWLHRSPPLPLVVPAVIVSPEIDAVTPESTWNTRLSPPPLTVTPVAGPVIVSVAVVSLSVSWVPVRVIVWGEEKTVGSNWIRLPAGLRSASAWMIARRREPVSVLLSLMSVTV